MRTLGMRFLISGVLLFSVTHILLACEGNGPSSKDLATHSRLTWDNGAIVRGDVSRKRIALIFTGGDYGEGTVPVLETLQQLHIRAGFFVTGTYLRQAGHTDLIKRALRDGHYVGPHSDQHLLYCSWEERNKTLVTRQQFETDLKKNIDDLQALGALKDQPVYFIPPYEWFNRDQSDWASQLNVRMFNFSPGSGSNRDYVPESDPRFTSSQKILEGILDYEKRAPHGLNGYILLLHLGADRKDKMHHQLRPLVLALRKRGYEFVRIDQMLQE